MNYSEKLKDPRWQKKRLEILSRDEFNCQLCGDKETTLHIHHVEYKGKNPWDTPSEYLKTLCKHCHDFKHLELTDLERFLSIALISAAKRKGGKGDYIKDLMEIITSYKNDEFTFSASSLK